MASSQHSELERVKEWLEGPFKPGTFIPVEGIRSLIEQLEALRQALRDSWDDYAIAIDDHASEEVRAEARHHMLRRFVAFQDEGWLASSPATQRGSAGPSESEVRGWTPAPAADSCPASEPCPCGDPENCRYATAEEHVPATSLGMDETTQSYASSPATKPYVRPADDPHTLVAKALAPDPAIIPSSGVAVGYPAESGSARSYANREPERAASDPASEPEAR